MTSDQASRFLPKLARLCGGALAVLSTGALAGRLVGMAVSASLPPRYLPLLPFPAILFLLLAGAIFVLSYGPPSRRLLGALYAAGGLVTAFGACKVFEALTGITVGSETLAALPRATLTAEGASGLVGAAFFIDGGAVLAAALGARGNDKLRHMASALAYAVALLYLPIGIASFYGTRLLGGNGLVPIPFSTALAFLLANTGIVAGCGAELAPLRDFVGNTARARLLRAFLPVSIFSIVLHGLLIQVLPFGERIDPVLLSVVAMLVSTSLTGFVILYVSRGIGEAMDRAEGDRRVAENTVAEHRRRLIESSKMSALGQMAAGIAHEINTPLLLLNGRAAMLRVHAAKEPIDRAAVLEEIAKIEATVQRIARIVSSQKAFSRNAENDPFEYVPVAHVIEDTVELCRHRFETRGIELRVRPISSELAVMCRPSQISQALLNLLNNAYDAVEHMPAPWVETDVLDLGDAIAIRVTDSGRGIPEDVKKSLMQPFFTTKPVGKGTGLGLSISHHILGKHGGQLSVDEKSENTRFVMTLPKKRLEEAPLARVA